jgi:hypothetical protein
MFVRIPLAQQQNINTSGTAITFNFRSTVPKLGTKHLHVVGVELDISANITGAATCSAINVYDNPLIISSLQLQRTPQRPIFSALPGNLLLAYQAMTNLGVPRSKFPIARAANFNSSITPSFRLLLPFDKPQASTNRFEYAWPLAAFVREGSLTVTFGGASVIAGSTGLTWTNSSGTVDANLVCIGLDDISMPPDLRWEMIDSSTTGNQTGIIFPSGNYRAVVYAPWALGSAVGLGGGDAANVANVTIDGSSYQQNNIFRKLKAVGSSTASGSSYRDQWIAQNVIDVYDAAGANLVSQGQIVPLWYPGPVLDATKGSFTAKTDFKLDSTLSSGSLSNGHRFLIGRTFPQSADEMASVAQVAGLNPAQIKPMKYTLDGRGVRKGKEQLVATRLVSVPSTGSK